METNVQRKKKNKAKKQRHVADFVGTYQEWMRDHPNLRPPSPRSLVYLPTLCLVLDGMWIVYSQPSSLLVRKENQPLPWHNYGISLPTCHYQSKTPLLGFLDLQVSRPRLTKGETLTGFSLISTNKCYLSLVFIELRFWDEGVS